MRRRGRARPRPSPRCRPRSRRRAGSSAARAGSAARRRRRGRASRRHRRRSRPGSASAKVAPPPSVARPRDGRRSPRRSRVRSRGRARSRRLPAAPRSNGSKIALALGLGDALGRGRRTRKTTSSPSAATRDLDRLAARRELERVLEQVDEHALDLGGVDARPAAPRPAATTATRARRPELLERARPTSMSTVHSSGCGSAAPTSRRERSSRFATTRSSRRVSIADRLDQRRALLRVEPVPDREPSLAARIAVSGERRSWLTARRTAVLIASLRRTARSAAPTSARGELRDATTAVTR